MALNSSQGLSGNRINSAGMRTGMIILKTSVGSRKSTQALGAPGKSEKLLIINKVTTNFSVSPCTPISYLSFSRPTEVSRIMTEKGRVLPFYFNADLTDNIIT